MFAVHCKTQKAVERWEILLTQDLLPWSHKKKVIFLAQIFYLPFAHLTKYTVFAPQTFA